MDITPDSMYYVPRKSLPGRNTLRVMARLSSASIRKESCAGYHEPLCDIYFIGLDLPVGTSGGFTACASRYLGVSEET